MSNESRKGRRLGRREVLGGVMTTAVAAVTSRAGAAVMPKGPQAGLAARHSGGPRLVPTGVLARRMELTAGRILRGKDPEFTDEMVLADVVGDRRRRFAEWSGDLSGRVIEALAWMPGAEARTRGARLARAIVQNQKADGRFGETGLAFTPEAIGKPHMSLVWGNGRLLVGLLEHHRATGDAATLASARRLGDFLLSIGEACASPAVRARLQGAAAQGFICYTQISEGLAQLAARTEDGRYLSAAIEAAKLLEPRGKQHSHGWLSTLRGAVEAHERGGGGHAAVLQDARTRFDELLKSGDFLVQGGVAEYFGGDAQKLGRDEGCSEADFLRLGLQLWRATADTRYLDVAERCLLNAFFFNQWSTGDFGSHVLSPRGSRPDDSIGRSWWCCTMHGYRAFADVLEAAVTPAGDRLRVNLYLAGAWSDGARTLAIDEAKPSGDGRMRFTFRLGGKGATALAFRRPHWASRIEVRAGGRPVEVADDNGFVVPAAAARSAVYEVTLVPRLRVVTRAGEEMGAERLGDKAQEAALFYGPWLMGADDEVDPLFFGEPWQSNTLRLSPQSVESARVGALHPHPFALPGARLRLKYEHAGFSQPSEIVLRPIAEQTSRRLRGVLAFWLRYSA